MKNDILYSVKEVAVAALELQKEESLKFIENASYLIADAFANGKKILIAGNGGSLCDAMHFAEELTGFYREKRKALPAIALSDPGHMSCVGNDVGFEFIFSRAVEALGHKDDILIVLTTSGNSLNLIHAIESAKEKKMKIIAFLGKTGGKIKGMAHLEWVIESFKTSDRIQEVHMAAIHIIIEIVEKLVFNLRSIQPHAHVCKSC